MPQPPPPTGAAARSAPPPAARAQTAPDQAPAAASQAGQAAAEFVRALSKAARAFALYDPSNAVVRQFLADYRSRAEEATRHGALVLDLLPFEMLREGETVYREEDRERSLAFKLFRDGVRRLTFQPGVPWEELLRFLEIMAVRASGVRQQEQDLVTMLRTSELGAIAFAAVEGFVPDEDNPEPAERRLGAGQGARVPAGFDTPFPRLPQPGPIEWRAVAPAALEALRAGAGAGALAATSLQLVTLLLAESERGVVPAGEVEQFLAEVRDVLVADGALPALAEFAELVLRRPPGPLRDALLRALGDGRVLVAVLDAAPAGGGALPPEAARLLPLVPAEAALDLLATEPDQGRRDLLIAMAEARLPADAEAVVRRLPTLAPAVARRLFHAVGARAPARLAEAAAALLAHGEGALQIEALRALEVAEGPEVPADRLLQLLHAGEEGVRLAAAEVLGRRGEARVFPAVAEVLTGGRQVSLAEAEALGRALAQLHPPRALELFDGWLQAKRGLFGRLTGGRQEETLQWAAVAGLGAHPSPDAVRRIEAVSEKAEEALRRHCYATLARRRRLGALHG